MLLIDPHTYVPNHFVRYHDAKQILLVTSSGDRDRWIVPGGGLEPNEDSSAAALREVMEEAGVIGRIARCLGSFEVI